MFRRAGLLVLLSSLLILIALPAGAVCSLARITSVPGPGYDYSYVYGAFADSCSNGVCTTAKSISDHAEALFWAIGYGNPTLGSGVDSGSLATLGLDGYGYFEPAILQYYFFYPAAIDAAWSDPGVDGCIDSVPVQDRCTALVVHDTELTCGGASGSCNSMAVLSARQQPDGRFDMSQPADGAIRLERWPTVNHGYEPIVGLFIPEWTVTVPAPTGGLYLDASCADPLAGYRVYVWNDTSGMPIAVDDRSLWDIPVGGQGAGGEPIPLGQATTLRFGCDASVNPTGEIYLGFTYVFDSGFESPRIELMQGGPLQCCGDADADGFCAAEFGGDVDCDDDNPDVGPRFPQVCGDGVNNDCESGNWPSLIGTGELDEDGDGLSACAGDCDDADAAIFPGNGAIERCDGVDNNCDGNIDNGATPLRQIQRTTAGSQFGIAVARVGDYTADGIDEILIGARGSSRASMYNGATLGWISNHESIPRNGGESYGTSLARLGQLGGDPLEEFIVGAPEYAEGGGVFIELDGGGVGTGNTAIALRSLEFGDDLGYAVDAIDDVNGDGAPDLLIGVRGDDDKGSVQVISGQAVLDQQPALIHSLTDVSGQNGDRFGYAVARIDDVDGDGANDLLVGAYLADSPTAPDTGEVFLFSGASGALIRTLFDPDGVAGDEFGRGLAAVEDLDGDGVQDVLAGAPGFDVGRGQAVLLSSASGVVLGRLSDTAADAGDAFGYRVALAGDVDGDGGRDLLVGAFLDDTPRGANAGSVSVYSGTTLERLALLSDPQGQTGGQFGVGIAGLDDIDGDGLEDVIVGSHLWDAPRVGVGPELAPNAGKVVVFSSDGFLDLDGDGVGNLCDMDIDGDGAPNADDCAPRDPLVIDQPDVSSVRFAEDDVTLSWSDGAAGTTYRVWRGEILGGIGSAICQAGDLEQPSFSTLTPPAGGAWFYLVAADGACGAGGAGADSAGVERMLPSCP